MKKVLITGGAGFIGSHLADELLENGYSVRVLDSLSSQVHGDRSAPPEYLCGDVELLVGDVRDADAVAKAIQDVDMVVHFAAAVGVGQSMYQSRHYTSVNCDGTATLLELLSNRPVEKLLVASSMSIYGEGAYQRADGRLVAAEERKREQLQCGHWEIIDQDGQPLSPIPTSEEKVPVSSSVYALSKYYQERMCLIMGEAYKIPTVAMRFFNAYGSRQALSNPYTGVLAIFAARCLSNQPPLVFEDGVQQRDFVHVSDVATGCRLALEHPESAGQVFNVGSGQPISVLQVAEEICAVLGRHHLIPEVTKRYRVGDIRHCFADISKAQQVLGYEPHMSFENGLLELTQWLERQIDYDGDGAVRAKEELHARGLVV
jgi:dTDP-L-rhamnose 4-epimerase